MRKIIKIDDLVIVTLDSGDTYQKTNVTDEEFNTIVNAESDDDILEIFHPKIAEFKQEVRIIEELEERVRKSNLLEWRNDAIYFPIVSELSVPKELALSILDAEDSNDTLRIETYRNFWTLLSLNPNEECRKNLWWFLQRNGLVVSKHGFFIAYRNVNPTNTEGVYTDNHTHTFKIKIGEVVSMPREKCCADNNELCSTGLHCGSKDWLKHNYCGTIGLTILVNPADVVSLPHADHYGKMRSCAYLPIDFCKFDAYGNVIPYDAKDGFDCEYVPKVIYEGIMGTESSVTYKLEIPKIPGITKDRITDNLLEIAKNCIIDRNIIQDEQES